MEGAKADADTLREELEQARAALEEANQSAAELRDAVAEKEQELETLKPLPQELEAAKQDAADKAARIAELEQQVLWWFYCFFFPAWCVCIASLAVVTQVSEATERASALEQDSNVCARFFFLF